MVESISILGAGSWGTSLAISLSSNTNIKLWTRNQGIIKSLKDLSENSQYLPGCKIPNNVFITSDLEEAITSKIIILAVPTQSLRDLCINLKKQNLVNSHFIIGCKGVEQLTLMFPSEIVNEMFGNNPIAVLSGPSFASEIGRKLPCFMTLACESDKVKSFLMPKLENNHIMLLPSTDLIGIQICAAIKNVIAIACGIILGKEIGYGAHAAVITKGMEEIRSIYVARTGNTNIDTLLGISCLGDLVMTCNALNSRNMSFGFAIGKSNGNIKQILSESKTAIEGAATAEAVSQLAAKLNISMPVCEAIHKLLRAELTVEDSISNLLSKKD
ncbi:MAG: glycerol-3-phosphate dehydrogenase [NAD(P)+] [Candidatus Mesenet longicola]|uniref:Glycerol-3-phosphate dehydrogenase [NAD(P)+] n=1 Tax=Candidatus Mesenet longicola TaxID=1892558 RepID=A0A8J3MN43_9RICK|nr:MAG: glycerol-3-phosphate dehydrogenase [NAD(P)+] [Candidatus Mesenet longicola]GHM59822.1 MAG: glycerol-3-phosphate dehydrogenase [NAD(P)+] [Candidatus Mesenet longicola]